MDFEYIIDATPHKDTQRIYQLLQLPTGNYLTVFRKEGPRGIVVSPHGEKIGENINFKYTPTVKATGDNSVLLGGVLVSPLKSIPTASMVTLHDPELNEKVVLSVDYPVYAVHIQPKDKSGSFYVLASVSFTGRLCTLYLQAFSEDGQSLWKQTLDDTQPGYIVSCIAEYGGKIYVYRNTERGGVCQTTLSCDGTVIDPAEILIPQSTPEINIAQPAYVLSADSNKIVIAFSGEKNISILSVDLPSKKHTIQKLDMQIGNNLRGGQRLSGGSVCILTNTGVHILDAAFMPTYFYTCTAEEYMHMLVTPSGKFVLATLKRQISDDVIFLQQLSTELFTQVLEK